MKTVVKPPLQLKSTNGHGTAPSEAPYRSQAERRAEGKALGSGRIFDEAICDFAGDYADQAERDHKAFVKAVREGRVKSVVESYS